MNPKRYIPTIFAVLLAATCMAGEPPRATPPYPGPSSTSVANVRDFGAKGDSKTDDTEAFRDAINSLHNPVDKPWRYSSGGTVFVPPGYYVVRETLDIPCAGICIQGSGNHSNISRNCMIVFRPEMDKESPEEEIPLFRFPHEAESPEGFSCRDITLVGWSKAKLTAFELWTGKTGAGNFRWGLHWENVGVFHFTTAFVVKREPNSGYQVGVLTIVRCNWSECRQAIVFDTVTSVNRMTISDNVFRHNRPHAGDPSKPALDIRGHGVTITNNNFEGQPQGLLLRDGEEYTVHQNYFEQNSEFAVHAVGCKSLSVQRNIAKDLGRLGNYDGKFQFEKVTGLIVDEPEKNVVLNRCRSVTWQHLQSCVVSTEKSK